MELFGLDFGCGQDTNVCTGDPCPITHEQRCCYHCPEDLQKSCKEEKTLCLKVENGEFD